MMLSQLKKIAKEHAETVRELGFKQYEIPTKPPRPYRGYLEPYETQIRGLLQDGMPPRKIAKMLFEDGVRSPNRYLNSMGAEAQIASFAQLIRRMK